MLFFLFLHGNICCGYSLEEPRQGPSNEYHNICFYGEIKKISTFLAPSGAMVDIWTPEMILKITQQI